MDYTWQEKKEPTIISKSEGIEIILNSTEYDLGLFSLASLMFVQYGRWSKESAAVCVYLAIYMYCDEKPPFREVVDFTDNYTCAEIAIDIIHFYNWNLPMFTFVDMLLYTYGSITHLEEQVINAIINRQTNERAIFYALVMYSKRLSISNKPRT